MGTFAVTFTGSSRAVSDRRLLSDAATRGKNITAGGGVVGTDDFTFTEPTLLWANTAGTVRVTPFDNADGETVDVVLQASQACFYLVKKVHAAGTTGGMTLIVGA